MATFATLDELEDYMGSGIVLNTTQAAQLLEIATAAIIDETGQQIEHVDDDEIEMRGTWWRDLWLPQTPVTDITAVTIDTTVVELTNIRWTSDGHVTWYPGYGPGTAFDGPDICETRHWGGPETIITVTYSHGYESIPWAVKGLCLDLCRRAIVAPDADVVASESLGAWSATYRRDAARTLTADDRRRIRRYKRKNRSIPTEP